MGCSFQRLENLQSIIFQLPENITLSDMSRVVVCQMIHYSINSNNFIKLSLDKPFNNGIDLVINRPIVLRQYFGTQVQLSSNNDEPTRYYTYGSGSSTFAVRMDPHNFVTREINPSIKYIANELHKSLFLNSNDFNLAGVNLSKIFDHCTVLVYYAGNKSKEESSLGYYTDCVYYVSDGKCVNQTHN